MIDTIFALSSGQPPAGIAVVRISGPAAFEAAHALGAMPKTLRRATLRALRGRDGDLLDRALVIAFDGPATATGEDLVELHCHGGRAVVAAVLAALASVPGCRLALPGEFTRRALANGRIDLSEAEGLADLLEAETEQQRALALRSLEGAISRAVRGWMTEVAMLSARIEVMLDYADEEDASANDAGAIRSAMAVLAATIDQAASAPPVERVRDGLRVVIAGPPNAGKSTLLNLLVGRDAAIVSPIAGTTRDRIEAPVVRHGRAYLLIDTAGLTETEDVVEAIGVDRARAAVAEADIVLWVSDEPSPHDAALHVHARADLTGREAVPAGRLGVRRDDAATIVALWDAMEERAATLLPPVDALPLRARHRELCRAAANALCEAPADPLLIGEHLRLARSKLAAITGVDATEVMLDQLFGRFCLGK